MSNSPYSRTNPFPGALLINRKLCGAGSEKDTRHFVISLKGSGISYEVGDTMHLFPTNCPDLVSDLLNALKFSGDEEVTGAHLRGETGADVLHQVRRQLIRLDRAVLVLTGDDANHDRVPIRDGPDPDASANWTAPRDKPAGRPQLAVAPHKPAAAASHEAVAEPLLSAAAA